MMNSNNMNLSDKSLESSSQFHKYNFLNNMDSSINSVSVGDNINKSSWPVTINGGFINTAEWNCMADSMQHMSRVFSKLLSDTNTEREKMLISAIGEIQKKIQMTTSKRKESEMVISQLNDRLLELEERLNSEDFLLLSKHPTEEEINLLERLKNISKEIAQRHRNIKALESQERMMKENLSIISNSSGGSSDHAISAAVASSSTALNVTAEQIKGITTANTSEQNIASNSTA